MFGTTSQPSIFRPTITQPQDFHQIDPMQNQVCRVCDEPAAGFHFGAFTCEGCKSFFGRSSNNQASIQDCKNHYRCVINKKNRTSCKACRLRKCLMVGMSKSGSRYGRRSNWFKIHCLMQQATSSQGHHSTMQQQQQQATLPTPTPPFQLNKSLKRDEPLRNTSPIPKRTNSLWRPIDPATTTPQKSDTSSESISKRRAISPNVSGQSSLSIIKPQPGYSLGVHQPQDPKQPLTLSNYEDPTIRTAANVSMLYSAAIGSNLPGFMPPLLNYHAALTQLPLYRQMLLSSIIASTRKAYAESVESDRNAVNIEALRPSEPRTMSDTEDPIVDVFSDDDDEDDDDDQVAIKHDKQGLFHKFKDSECDPPPNSKVSNNQMSVV